MDATHLARLEREAFERGRREGEAAASRALEEKVRCVIEEFARSAASLAAHKSALRIEVEREVVALALAVARKVLRRELSVDPSIVLAVVRSCLAELANSEIYRLRLNPQDVEAVQGYLRQKAGARIEVLSDGSLARGGAIFETTQGLLDARLETQLLEIERGLADQ